MFSKVISKGVTIQWKLEKLYKKLRKSRHFRQKTQLSRQFLRTNVTLKQQLQHSNSKYWNKSVYIGKTKT
jgi:hypothetical protein